MTNLTISQPAAIAPLCEMDAHLRSVRASMELLSLSKQGRQRHQGKWFGNA